MAINEKQKYPTNKARYDENYLKIFGSVKATGEKEMIRKCKCTSSYQDARYGDGNRVHNKAKSRYGKDKVAWTCTVCGVRKE